MRWLPLMAVLLIGTLTGVWANYFWGLHLMVQFIVVCSMALLAVCHLISDAHIDEVFTKDARTSLKTRRDWGE